MARLISLSRFIGLFESREDSVNVDRFEMCDMRNFGAQLAR